MSLIAAKASVCVRLRILRRFSVAPVQKFRISPFSRPVSGARKACNSKSPCSRNPFSRPPRLPSSSRFAGCHSPRDLEVDVPHLRHRAHPQRNHVGSDPRCPGHFPKPDAPRKKMAGEKWRTGFQFFTAPLFAESPGALKRAQGERGSPFRREGWDANYRFQDRPRPRSIQARHHCVRPPGFLAETGRKRSSMPADAISSLNYSRKISSKHGQA